MPFTLNLAFKNVFRQKNEASPSGPTTSSWPSC
jgi:hypothetical protein